MRKVTIPALAALFVAAMTVILFWDTGSVVDSRDGKVYRTVRIGAQTWMAENLNHATGSSWCYGDDSSNCDRYGRLYDWNTAMQACPAGWRLPTHEDWNDLVQVAGGYVAGTKLKSKSPDGDATDVFGFSALPGGYRLTGGSFNNVGADGKWWSATENDAGSAIIRVMNIGFDNVNEFWSFKSNGNSVRCVRE